MSVRVLAIVVVAIVSMATGCGGGESADGGDSGGGDAAASTSLAVTATEYEFAPSEWTAAADTDVTVTLTNDGSLQHEWAVLEQGTTISSEGDFSEDLVVAEVEAVPSGDSGSTTVNLPAGTYQVICAIPGHFDQGMEGTLTVAE